MDGTVLIADDDRTIRTVLTQAFTRAGCKVHATSSLVTLMRWVEDGKGDLVVSDVVMPDGNGLENLPQITKLRPNLPVIIISAQNTIVTAIRANEAKAFDYLPKPFDLPELMHRAAKALERRHPPQVSGDVAEVQDAEIPLVGQSTAMQTLYRLIARAMNAPAPVLVLGEAGTGKSLIASSLHKFSKRADQPMVVLHPEMMESQSTIRDALMRCGSGTLILDGVSDLSPAAQLRLLHILGEPGDQNLRLVSTAAPNILADVQNGNFRNDLFFRLSSLQLTVPALRERVEDISVLAQHFIATLQADIKFELSQAGAASLRDFNWPGNVRQLQMVSPNTLLDGNAVKEVLKKAGPSNAISALLPSESLAESVGLHVQRYFDLHGANLPPDGVYQRILREIEVPLIEISLAATSGNQAKCADLLGINRNTLRKKINDLEIVVTRRRKMM
jgi:two-component system nitrogen regulation response regulator GlnG